jgi:hypothetical protein
MVAVAEHPHRIRGLALPTPADKPRIVQRTDQEFVPAILAELGTTAGRTKLALTEAKERGKDGTLRLFQPVHRTFHVVLVEAFCEEVGFPRVDPAKMLGMGLVLRRVVPAPGVKDVDAEVHGWMRSGDKGERIEGWIKLDDRRRRRDPDPAQRPPEKRTGNAVIDARIALRFKDDSFAETVAPLFPAPPDVCAAAGRTVLYGMVPLTSSERTDDPPPPPPIDDATMAAMLPPFLKAGTRTWEPFYEAGTETAGYMEALAGAGAFADTPEGAAFRKVLDRIAMWYQVGAERAKQAYTEANDHAEKRARFDVDLDEWLKMAKDGWAPKPLGAELTTASEWLDRRDPDAAPSSPISVTDETDAGPVKRDVGREALRARWTLDAKQAKAVHSALKTLLQARLAAINPGGGRFDDPDAIYRVQAFARVERCCGCPPELVWSQPSERFTIIPWFETGAAPPVRVTLPEAKLESLKKLKPNVTFVTPKSVADALQGMKLKDLTAGKKPSGKGPGLDMVCGFNIPIITLCAFIVLSIFLSLLNIIFFWLPLVKICIPLPKLTPPKAGQA